jgi:acetylglutamate kinase
VGTLGGPDPFGRWRGQTVVIKYGGSAMERTDLATAFAREVVRLHAAGAHPVVIHGGGPQIDALMRRLGKTPRALDVSHLWAGVEPPAEIAGRVVVAGGRMRGEEGRA